MDSNNGLDINHMPYPFQAMDTERAEIAQTLFTNYLDLMYCQELGPIEGLDVLRLFTITVLSNVRRSLIEAGVLYADRFLWQFMAEVNHSLAHAPEDAQEGSDDWLESREGE